MREHRHVGRFRLGTRPAWLTESDAVEAEEQRGKADQNAEDEHQRQQRLTGKGRAHHQEFAHEDAERRQPGDGDDAEDQAPAQHRMGLGETTHIGDALRALDLGDMADGKEDRRFGQRMHGHVQQPGEIGERAAHAESECDDAHMLDRRIGEHALDVAAAVQHECREYERQQAERDHQGTRRRAPRRWPRAAS